MTDQQWRAISAAEASLVAAILAESNVLEGAELARDIHYAQVFSCTDWILDVDNPNSELRSGVPDGPFPGRAFVPNSFEYQGEIIIWMTGGRVSGLEYAWITDEPPNRWPRPDEIQIVNE